MDNSKTNSVCERTFISFCKRSIENAAIDFDRVQKRRCKKEMLFSDSNHLNDIFVAIRDSHNELIPIFQIDGHSKTIDIAQLFDALHNLSDKRKKIVTMYYFHRMSDREIGLKLNIKRRTVNSNREGALLEMRVHLEELMYGA